MTLFEWLERSWMALILIVTGFGYAMRNETRAARLTQDISDMRSRRAEDRASIVDMRREILDELKAIRLELLRRNGHD